MRAAQQKTARTQIFKGSGLASPVRPSAFTLPQLDRQQRSRPSETDPTGYLGSRMYGASKFAADPQLVARVYSTALAAGACLRNGRSGLACGMIPCRGTYSAASGELGRGISQVIPRP